MVPVNQVADYIVVKMEEGRVPLNLLKLQKLLYYIQAWSLATEGRGIFKERFQAWVHGPVCRTIYDRFKDTHSLYNSVDVDKAMRESASALPKDIVTHIDEVLEAYAGFTGTQLEAMTHRESPWVTARGSLAPAERCEVEIDEGLMANYYSKLLQDAEAEELKARM
ncbi:Panacea domain-containing protein [Xanthomonas campestris]|uniref:Panacea domain-containing protein n=1 Tax=Xanthomonas campestris TaxID=339 RepID=UPI001C84426E|nr:type II toxin-antitoxin system antitoxin SocA domain-containing protein [Xanthomonas campestris]MCC5051262.1 DUF4065 domain-containing protein [Xanthomonas campestris pv. aberrans]MEB1125958.1 type II toxin-antitoxin system antitoxin SocA domain-containing protein [Xanthomonas campestris pv. campestris]